MEDSLFRKVDQVASRVSRIAARLDKTLSLKSFTGPFDSEELNVASPTKVYMRRQQMKVKKMGRKRKNYQANFGTTPTRAAFFGDAPADPAANHAPQASSH